MSANAAEGFAYLALASSTRNDAWVAHVFAAENDNARFTAEIWPLAVRK